MPPAESDSLATADPTLTFQLFLRVVVQARHFDSCALARYKTFRSGDGTWCDAMEKWAEQHAASVDEPLAFHYAGMTVRHPGLRAIEEAVDVEHARQGQFAAAAQACDALDSVRTDVPCLSTSGASGSGHR
ncbi:hypothetical protein HDU86_002025 [Geranomyces michiganensis]|nr:hypothetical protein HDU86_002025 [Geranomyces michiganensis]